MFFQRVSAQDITFRHLTPDDGLSHVSVNALYCDERGFIWIGTREGLNCYNSNGIRVFKWHKDDPNSLFYNAVQRITGDGAGNLYLLCSEGIARYDSTREKFGTLLQGNVSAICYEEGLFVARGTGIYRCDTETGELSLLHELPAGKATEITWMLRDSRDTWWIGTNTGLFEYAPDGNFTQPIAGCNITNIYEDSRNRLWMGTWNQGCYFRSAEGRWDNLRASSRGLRSDFVRCFAEDSAGKIWIGTFLGLNRLDPEQGSLKSYVSDGSAGSLSHDSIWAMICDRQGTVWVGTYFGGVNYFNPECEIFTRYGTSDRIGEGLSSPIVGKIVEDGSHDLWICTEGGGLNILDRRTGKFRHYRHSGDPNSLSHDNVKAICNDPERGVVWVGTHLGGLNRFDPKTNRFTHYRSIPGNPRTIPSDIVRDIVLHDQKLIIATQDGVCEFDPDTGESRQLFQDPPGNLIRAVSSLLYVEDDGWNWFDPFPEFGFRV